MICAALNGYLVVKCAQESKLFLAFIWAIAGTLLVAAAMSDIKEIRNALR